LNEQNDVPVYLFTGFLESGKTKFIQETLEDKRFNNGERTLLLVCEEGEEEYAPDQFSGKNVFIREVENEAELTAENLDAWLKEPLHPRGGGIQRHVDAGCAVFRHAPKLGGVSGIHVRRRGHLPDL
jgi:hypothetical protein